MSDEPSPQFAAGPDDTVYPVNVGSLEWVLRYGADNRVLRERMIIAGVVGFYANLIDPNATQGDAIAALKRARKAQRDVRG